MSNIALQTLLIQNPSDAFYVLEAATMALSVCMDTKHPSQLLEPYEYDTYSTTQPKTMKSPPFTSSSSSSSSSHSPSLPELSSSELSSSSSSELPTPLSS